MANDTRFQVRDTKDELKKFDKALIDLGHVTAKGKPDRGGWYRTVKRETIKKANSVSIELDSSELTTLIIAKGLAQTRLQNIINESGKNKEASKEEQIQALKNQMKEIDKAFHVIEELHDDRIYYEFEKESK